MKGKKKLADEPDWEQIKKDVNRKLDLLRMAWEHTATIPEVHGPVKRDLYVPALRYLSAFCVCVDEHKRKGEM